MQHPIEQGIDDAVKFLEWIGNLEILSTFYYYFGYSLPILLFMLILVAIVMGVGLFIAIACQKY